MSSIPAHPRTPVSIRATLALACLTLASCSGSSQDGSGRPTMFRGGPEHPGVYRAADAGAIAGVRWAFGTGGAVRSSPTIHGAWVYVGSSDGHLYALNGTTGAERWRFDARSAVPSTPAVGGGLVFFQDRAGVVHAVRERDGDEAWRFTTGADLALPWGSEGWDYFISSPTLVGDTLVVGAGDGNLYALAARSGTLLWRYQTEGRIRSSAAVADGAAYVGSADGSVYAVDLATGDLRWRFDTEGRSLASADFGFDRRTVQSSPAVADSTVFVGARDGHLYAIDEQSGTLRWRFDHEISWVVSSPAVDDGVVYAGSSDGRFVQAVDAKSGAERWRTPTPQNVFASPAIVGQTICVGDFAGNFLGLDRRTGTVRWRMRLGDAVMSSAAAVGRVLYVGSDDGHLYAIEGADSGRGREKAVFWDASLAGFALYNGHRALRDDLASAGYRVLDADGLARFMTASIADSQPSVVVFAIDYVPPSVAPVGADTVLFRRYLQGPGRIVWVGYPPASVLHDPRTGRPTGMDMGRTEALLGVRHPGSVLDTYSAQATPAGRAHGLPDWWLDRAGVDPTDVTTVLASDELGRAVAWVKTYGGRPGSGFVRFWARRDPLPDPSVVRRLAEDLW